MVQNEWTSCFLLLQFNPANMEEKGKKEKPFAMLLGRCITTWPKEVTFQTQVDH
jgi:hypothetical protein